MKLIHMANKNSLLSIPPPEMKALESLIPEKKPKWLIRAMDPATSTTKANETVRTKSGYSEDLGGEVLVPTIRMGKKGLYKPDNPFKEAIAKKDYILVKGPKGPETAARATNLSRYISDVLITNARKNFQSGGLNMAKANEQMNIMGFEPKEQEIDPVSGNEVPLGGTPEGVRDDIDAKLSSGEMVIPEYAVNYHGVETYIDSIQKAQEGYQQMQDMGLMGNPDEAIMDESEPLPKMQDEEDVPEYQFGGLASTPIPQLPPETPSSVPTLTPSNISNTPLIQPLRPTSIQSTPVMSQYPNGYFIEVGADQYKFVSPPGAEKQYTDIYTRAQVGNSIIAPVGTTPESVYGPSFQTYGPNYTYSPTQQKTSLLTAGEYKVIPYVNSSGNIFYATSIGGQIQGSIPSGYFPATDQQVDISKQLQTITPKEVPVGGPPSGVTGSGGGGGVSVSGPPSVSTPTPSAQAVATGAEISGSKAPSVMSPVPTPTTADIISSTQPPSFAQTVAGLATDTPDAPAINLGKVEGIGELSVSATDISDFGLEAAANIVPSVLGLKSGFLGPIGVGIKVANAIANHASQPQTAVDQAVMGIPGTGFDPITGISIHAVSTLFGMPVLAAYNMNNPTDALSPTEGFTQMAIARKADLTGLKSTDNIADLYFSINKKTGNWSYSGPVGISTENGSFNSDGSFTDNNGNVSATGYKSDFQSLSYQDQATISFKRSKHPLSFLIGVEQSYMTPKAIALQNKMNSLLPDIQKDLPNLSEEQQNDIAVVRAISTEPNIDPSVAGEIGKKGMTSVHGMATEQGAKALSEGQLAQQQKSLSEGFKGMKDAQAEAQAQAQAQAEAEAEAQTALNVAKMNAAMSANQPSLGPPGTAATGQDAAAGISSTGAEGIQGIQSGGMSGGGTGGSGTVICTELYKQGLLDDIIFKADEEWGEVIPSIVKDGYHLWAKPIVKQMQKSSNLTKKINWLATPVTKEIAHQMGVGKGSKIGLAMLSIAIPICAVLGAAMLPFKQKNTNLVLGDK